MTWTKEEHEAVRREVARGGHLDNDEAHRALAEIERGWTEIETLLDKLANAQGEHERLTAENAETAELMANQHATACQIAAENSTLSKRLSHAHDAANKLYQAAIQASEALRGTYNGPMHIEDAYAVQQAISILRTALDPTEAEACAKEATRRDGLEAEIEGRTAQLDMANAEIERLTNALATASETNAMLDRALANHKALLTAAEAGGRDAYNKLDDARAEIGRLRQQVDNAENEAIHAQRQWHR